MHTLVARILGLYEILKSVKSMDTCRVKYFVRNKFSTPHKKMCLYTFRWLDLSSSNQFN